MSYFDADYPEDGIENIRWDHATDTYAPGPFVDKPPLTAFELGFRLRLDVVPDTVVEVQDEML